MSLKVSTKVQTFFYICKEKQLFFRYSFVILRQKAENLRFLSLSNAMDKWI